MTRAIYRFSSVVMFVIGFVSIVKAIAHPDSGQQALVAWRGIGEILLGTTLAAMSTRLRPRSKGAAVIVRALGWILIGVGVACWLVLRSYGWDEAVMVAAVFVLTGITIGQMPDWDMNSVGDRRKP
jgi:hypothetical protein